MNLGQHLRVPLEWPLLFGHKFVVLLESLIHAAIPFFHRMDLSDLLYLFVVEPLHLARFAQSHAVADLVPAVQFTFLDKHCLQSLSLRTVAFFTPLTHFFFIFSFTFFVLHFNLVIVNHY